MSRVCQVTGKRPAFGNNVSHSHRRTRRRFDVNLQTKRYWLESERRWVRLRVSTKGMKVVDRRGVERVVAEIRARGEKV
ncbi:50S ribosomal protein L28 [Nocardiopsis chromatogenes]|uniref:50S ribosomal protein L28 n=1 Tax=Nocardiopsis chromatogenes TaxID=280239 RepID=UPI00034BC335|nr:50S ribosomal protein L28 [Nocardiopsis chromatogenes]